MAGNVPSYSDLFPVLPLGAAPQKTQGAWAPPKSKKVTKSFVVSGVERRTEQRTGKFGKKETETVFERVMQQTGTHIQTASDKERNLNILITGKESAVNKAWVILSKEIQQPVRETITIPEAHHRIIIGKGGATLKKIEADTGTRINITRERRTEVVSGTGDSIGSDTEDTSVGGGSVTSVSEETESGGENFDINSNAPCGVASFVITAADKVPMQCYACGEYGHMARDCAWDKKKIGDWKGKGKGGRCFARACEDQSQQDRA